MSNARTAALQWTRTQAPRWFSLLLEVSARLRKRKPGLSHREVHVRPREILSPYANMFGPVADPDLVQALPQLYRRAVWSGGHVAVRQGLRNGRVLVWISRQLFGETQQAELKAGLRVVSDQCCQTFLARVPQERATVKLVRTSSPLVLARIQCHGATQQQSGQHPPSGPTRGNLPGTGSDPSHMGPSFGRRPC